MKTLFAIACLAALSLSSTALAGVIDAQDGLFVNVKSVSLEVEKVDATTNRIHVMVIGTFPNDCLAPQADTELVSASFFNDTKTAAQVSLIQLGSNRVCTLIEKPVDVVLHAAHIYYPTNGMNTPVPDVFVNGVKGIVSK